MIKYIVKIFYLQKGDIIMAIQHLTKQDYDNEVTRSNVPVSIDFYADWCGPCKMATPMLEELATEIGESAKIRKVNVDEEPDLASKFGVMSIPTFVVLKDGKLDSKVTGLCRKEDLKKMLGV